MFPHVPSPSPRVRVPSHLPQSGRRIPCDIRRSAPSTSALLPIGPREQVSTIDEMSITAATPAPSPPDAQSSPDAATVTLAVVRADPEVHVLISAANENLGAIGYTDHGFRHAEVVARDARLI